MVHRTKKGLWTCGLAWPTDTWPVDWITDVWNDLLWNSNKKIFGLMVVVGFLGCLAVFLRFFFLMFCQSLWPASSEDRSQNSVLWCSLWDSSAFIVVGSAFCPFQETG